MEDNETKPTSLSSMSKTPSWISIGFVLGALFVWLLPKPAPEIIEVPVRDESPLPLVAQRAKPDFSELEAVFSEWDDYAVWSDDTTELALWDIETSQYSRFYEVLRSADEYYFRSIDRLKHPVLTHGVPADAPLLFTETEKQREEWLEQSDSNTWDSITKSIREMSSSAPEKQSIEK
ncbi:MAG: hypothetical protein CMI16_10775 [Opitutaceae bacterium]|jgi:hypothetical protein|nr:hypothetical protein [Opitutaceae bacterium]|tara:strand:+ start:692 stop:1222 length:531 start_codon:yes stop_codon:yes gene_type:complete